MTFSKLLTLAIFFILSAYYPVYAQESKTIYIAPDDHTDYLWSANEAFYENYFSTGLEYYLQQMTDTDGAPKDQRMRWNTDGTLWLSTYEKNHTAAEFSALMDRFREGRLNSPMNTLVSVHGGSPLEVVLRDMYYAGRLERRFNVKFDLAIAMENQVASFGLPSLWAGAGAKYSWKGVCAFHPGCTSVADSGNRETEAYWATGKDNSRILTKWQSLQVFLPGAVDRNQGPGGYAEARFARDAVLYADQDATFQSKWPYGTIGLFGAGWDDPDYFVPLNDGRSFPSISRQLSTPNRRVVVSNISDFFKDFESSYGSQLPSQNVTFGNEWELCTAQYAAKSQRVKQAIERLRAAEAAATLEALANPSFLNGRQAARDDAYTRMALYFEHNVCGGGPGVTTDERVNFQERTAQAIENYVNGYLEDARIALGARIDLPSANIPRFYVFNQLGIRRTDIAEYPVAANQAYDVVDLTTGQVVPSQIIQRSGNTFIQLTARNVPPFGYKVFGLRTVNVPRNFPVTARVGTGYFQNPQFRLDIDNSGAITNFRDRLNGNRQLVRAIDRKFINDTGTALGGVLQLEDNGPVSATYRVEVPTPVNRTTRITIYKELQRVDIENRINQNFDSIQTYSFNFNIDQPIIRHEEVGAVITAKLAPAGDYSPRGINSRYDWQTLNHFADISTGDDTYGITLSNADAYFMKVGRSSITNLDSSTPRIDVLAGGRAVGNNIGLVFNQGGDSAFVYRFSLIPHSAYDQGAAMRAALAHQNPFLTGAVTGTATGVRYPSSNWSFMGVGNPNHVVWALKPHDDGIDKGIVVRVWNQSSLDSPINLFFGAPYRVASRTRVTHVETDLLASAELSRSPTGIGANQIASYRITLRP